MKKNILLGSSFTIFILLTQVVLAPPVIAQNQNNDMVSLGIDQKGKLESLIERFTGTTLYQELFSIYEAGLNEDNEIEISALLQMLDVVVDYLEDQKPSELPTEYIFPYSVNELIDFILIMIVEGLMFLTFGMALQIMDDVSDVMQYYTDCLSEPEFIAAVSLHIFLPDIYDTLIQLEIIKDYALDIPDTPEERKQYLKETFNDVTKDAFEFCVIGTAYGIYVYYLGPKMGYLSRMAQDIYFICDRAKELKDDYRDFTIKIEYLKEIFIDVPVAFFDFVRPNDGEVVIDFFLLLDEIEEAKNATEQWRKDPLSAELFIDLTILTVMLTDLIVYYSFEEDDPWLRPIQVFIEVDKQRNENITLSFGDDEQEDIAVINNANDSGEAVLYYYTANKSSPKGLHQFTVRATSSNGEIIEKQESAFSDGVVKLEIDHSAETKSKQSSVIDIKSWLDSVIRFFDFPQRSFFSFFQYFLPVS